jgi:DNA endonuclease activator SAE2/CtIP C-terminus
VNIRLELTESILGTASSKTINGEFEIDRDKNSGLGFQYDAVVRDKDERRGLEAGDCECCRDVRLLPSIQLFVI